MRKLCFPQYGIVVSAIAVASVVQTAVAGENVRDVSQEINILRSNIETAELYTLSNKFTFRRRQGEEDVVHGGCKFLAIEKKDVDTLVDVLVGAQLKEQPKDINGYEARMVVYLRTKEGTKIPLVLAREYINAPVVGTYNLSVSVGGKMGFADAMKAWKTQRTPINKQSLMCQD